jgi:hypothetical protein
VAALIGAGIGLGLGFLTYRVLGALEVVQVPNSVSVRPMDMTTIMASLTMLVGAASGGIIGAIVGAVGAIVQAIERTAGAPELMTPYVGPAKQRL